jgi:hypothetical protein
LGLPRTAAPDLARAEDASSAEDGVSVRLVNNAVGNVPDMRSTNGKMPNTPSSQLPLHRASISQQLHEDKFRNRQITAKITC